MYEYLKNLIFYVNFDSTGIITELAGIEREVNEDKGSVDELRGRIYKIINRLLNVATDYGFDGNLWQSLVAFSVVNDENPYSITCECAENMAGSADAFFSNDADMIFKIFNYDFTALESKLGINCFSLICDYTAKEKSSFPVNEDVKARVRQLSRELKEADSHERFGEVIRVFYRKYGVGMLGLNRAFRISESGGCKLIPVGNMDRISFKDLCGYELQHEKLIANVRRFLNGEAANNCLLYGDSGTGKSASVKALENEFYDEGLRLIEVYRYQYRSLSDVIAGLKKRSLKFIIYLDELSFEENETEYKLLKAVIEGGVETRPENILIFATSNRRHLVKETFDDRSDFEKRGDVHRSDSVEEKLSLFNRFGLTINFSKPDRGEYREIVRFLADKSNVNLSDEELFAAADTWALRHGGMSGRTAEQFINSLSV